MKNILAWLCALTALFVSSAYAQQSPDSSSHAVRFVTVAKDVKLEVLDWGGSGRPLIFLAGMGNTAHVFDNFAPQFTLNYHVYGITRRGFGVSSHPDPTVANYSATRLGDDVIAVIDSLKLNRPVLVGHSFAGAELSSIGSRHPEKVAGLIYLDAGYAFAYYDRAHGDLWLDMIDLRKKIDALESGVGDRKQLWQDISTDVSHLPKPLGDLTQQIASMPALPTPAPIGRAIQFGWEKHTHMDVPILAIFAVPPVPDARITDQIDAFEAGLPSAHVVRLQNATHYLFNSNQADVLREMNAFLAKLH
ncbi:MAG: alpha/beta fold hydrolase [Bryobacteraceae bacterium]